MHTETVFAAVECSPSSNAGTFSSSLQESLTLSPTQLLSLAIKKRRSLYEGKNHDFRRVLGNTGMISSLCKFLGEGRAKRRRHRSGRSRRKQQSRKRSWDEEQQLVIDINGDVVEQEGSQEEQIVPCNEQDGIQSDEQQCVMEPLSKRRKNREGKEPFGDFYSNFDASAYESGMEQSSCSAGLSDSPMENGFEEQQLQNQLSMCSY